LLELPSIESYVIIIIYQTVDRKMEFHLTIPRK
jgi:hypothetical protein